MKPGDFRGANESCRRYRQNVRENAAPREAMPYIRLRTTGSVTPTSVSTAAGMTTLDTWDYRVIGDDVEMRAVVKAR